MVCDWAVTVTKTSGGTGDGHSKEKRPAGILSPSAVTIPRDSVNRESSDVRDSSEIGGRNLHPRKEPSSWEEGESI